MWNSAWHIVFNWYINDHYYQYEFGSWVHVACEDGREKSIFK